MHRFGPRLVAGALSAAIGASVFGGTVQLIQNFNGGEPTVHQEDNRTAPHDFGFSNTNNVNGGAGPTGEIGGSILRSNDVTAFYGFETGVFPTLASLSTTPGAQLLTASGSIRATAVGSEVGGFFLGYFNSTDPDTGGIGTNPADFLGFRINSNPTTGL